MKSIILIMLMSMTLVAQDYDFTKLKGKTNVPIKKTNHIVYYTASWCPGCREFCPKVHKFIDDNKDLNFDVIVVSFDYKKQAFDELIKKEKIKLYIKFGNGKETGIYDFCGIQIPWISYFDKNGKLLFSERATEKLLEKIKTSLKNK